MATTEPVSDWKKSLIQGKQDVAPRITLYGSHGIGKSTLAAQFPKPIFISTEDGLSNIEATSFPKASTALEVMGNINTLIKEPHDFKTVVVDSIDWLVEPLIVGKVESENDAKELAFGRGQVMIAETFRTVLNGLDILRREKGMNVVLLAHASVVRYEDPRAEPYDRYQPKIPNRCNAILQEWTDVLAFCGFKIIVKKSDVGFNNQVNRGITTGERLLHLVENPAYMAKNRFTAPDIIPMTIEALAKVVPIKNIK